MKPITIFTFAITALTACNTTWTHPPYITQVSDSAVIVETRTSTNMAGNELAVVQPAHSIASDACKAYDRQASYVNRTIKRTGPYGENQYVISFYACVD